MGTAYLENPNSLPKKSLIHCEETYLKKLIPYI